jgi:hypothetical protein
MVAACKINEGSRTMDGKCLACGQEVLFIKEAVYDGFTKTGDVLKCSSCGASQDAPDAGGDDDPLIANTPSKLPSIFSEEDRSPGIDLFADGENRIICRYCEHYVLNPFTQRCGKHDKEVEATDTCFDFTAQTEGEDEGAPAT